MEYLKAPSRRVSWLRVDRLLGEWRIPKDSPAGRKEFARVMEERRRRQDGQEFGALKRGWCLGDEAFRRELLEQVQVGPGPSHYGEVLMEAVELKAQRLLQEGLRKLGWSEQDLAQKRKGDEGKVKLALELRNNTTMPLEWIAGRLQMGTRGYLTWLLQRQKTQRQGNMSIPLTDPLTAGIDGVQKITLPKSYGCPCGKTGIVYHYKIDWVLYASVEVGLGEFSGSVFEYQFAKGKTPAGTKGICCP